MTPLKIRAKQSGTIKEKRILAYYAAKDSYGYWESNSIFRPLFSRSFYNEFKHEFDIIKE